MGNRYIEDFIFKFNKNDLVAIKGGCNALLGVQSVLAYPRINIILVFCRMTTSTAVYGSISNVEVVEDIPMECRDILSLEIRKNCDRVDSENTLDSWINFVCFAYLYLRRRFYTTMRRSVELNISNPGFLHDALDNYSIQKMQEVQSRKSNKVNPFGLFPTQYEIEVPHFLTPFGECYQVTLEQLQEFLEEDDVVLNSACKMSLKHLRQIKRGLFHESIEGSLLKVINRIIRGDVIESAKDLLYGGCVEVLPKDDGKSYRPLVRCPLIVEIACELVARSFPRSTAVRQKGLVQGGTCELFHDVKSFKQYTPDCCLLKLDVRDAFNRISRESVITYVEEERMDILNLVLCFYGFTRSVFVAGQQIDLSRGIYQGQNLSKILFCKVLHQNIIKKISILSSSSCT
jgi:hypothetical protein